MAKAGSPSAPAKAGIGTKSTRIPNKPKNGKSKKKLGPKQKTSVKKK